MRRGLVPTTGALLALLFGSLSATAAVGTEPATAALPVGAPAPTARSACAATSGVLVAVDFSHWGGSVDLGCATGLPANGLDAMHAAGFLTADDESDGPDFVCRIGLTSTGTASERPTPQQDPCVSTPPASAYWAFYFAPNGQNTWSYSGTGVAGYHPSAGSVEGWAFGSGAPPSATPAQLRAAAAPPPSTTVPSSTAPLTSTSAPPSTVPPSTVPPATAAGSDTTTVPPTTGSDTSSTSVPTSTAARTQSPTTSPTHPVPSTASGGSRIVAVGPVGDPPRDGGSGGTPTGLLVAAGIVAALAAAGTTVAVRRRRAA